MNQIYYITVLVIALLFVLNCVTGNNRKNNIRLFNIGVFVLLLVDCLKDPYVYPDIGNYSSFLKYGYAAASEESYNIGYTLLNSIFRCFSVNFVSFSILLAVFTVVVYTNELKKYSVNPIYSLLLYTMMIYIHSFWVLRQALAVVFVLCSLKYILSRNLKKYIVTMALAVSMHTTAIVAVPLYYLYTVKPNKRNIFIVILVAFIAIFSFKSIVTMVVGADSHYSHYLEMQGGDTTIRLISKVFFVLLYVYALKNHCTMGLNYIILICALYNVFIYIGGMTIFGMFRLRQYFDVAEVLGLPLIVHYCGFLRNKVQRVCVKISVFVYFILVVMTYIRFIESDNFENGYRFFFLK